MFYQKQTDRTTSDVSIEIVSTIKNICFVKLRAVRNIRNGDLLSIQFEPDEYGIARIDWDSRLKAVKSTHKTGGGNTARVTAMAPPPT